jgi:hypothetical protein
MKTDTNETMATNDVVESLLRNIRKNLYRHNDTHFHQDRKRLISVITWTARWMEQRGLSTSPKAYYTLISQRIADIVEHGEPEKYAQYLPAYLLKTIQEYIRHHGDALYDKLKRIGNYLETIELKTRKPDPHSHSQRRFIQEMERLHQIAAPIRRTKSDPGQMKLL